MARARHYLKGMAKRFAVDDSALYLGDNGICLCGAHLGMTARFSGRDISGQRVYRLQPEDDAEGRKMSAEFQGFKCEVCKTPQRLIVAA